jgi:hypothetical protein
MLISVRVSELVIAVGICYSCLTLTIVSGNLPHSETAHSQLQQELLQQQQEYEDHSRNA